MEVDQFGYSTKSIRVPAEFAPWRPVHRRLVADPVVLPDESRKVVCSELLEVWVVAEPALRPLPSVSVVRSLPEPVGRVVAVPVVRPEASRKVVRSDVPLVWVVAVPVLRPWPSVKVVRSAPEPDGRVIAVPTVRPEASRIVVRSEVPVICVVAEPALRPLPSVRVVLSVLDCAVAVVAKTRHATRRKAVLERGMYVN